MLKQIPNALTVMRVLLALAGAAALWLSYSWSETGLVPLWLGEPELAARTLARFAVIAFIIAAATDWLDGWLARRWQAQSAFGALIDPIADKLLVDGYLLVYLLILKAPVDIAVPIIALILRDIAVTAARFMPALTAQRSLEVSAAAKLKTALAMIVSGFPLLASPLDWDNLDFVLNGWVVALWVTAALSLLTLVNYFRK
jgi:CDP-diacylglycerol---glycerol-3-phosphate 3-phosphatidyltransferase